jgi:hypothetical protein
MPPKKARSEKNQLKISFFTTSEKENPWSEDETDTGTTTEAIVRDGNAPYWSTHHFLMGHIKF